MNDLRFDEFSKALAQTKTRRHALKLFGATAAGGVMSLVGAGRASADARCYLGGHGCRENTECCSNFCDPTTATCACAPGQYECPSTGICVGPCGPGQTFDATTCECVCPTGTQPCGNTCCAASPAQVCVNGGCCTNPRSCTSNNDCCQGFRCNGEEKGIGLCQPCTNPTTCKTSGDCCSGYVCALGGVCVPQ